MPAKQTQRGGAGRAYGLGFELACAVAGFVLVGVWIDRHYSSGPWGTLVCLVLGLIGGFYNLFRETSRLTGKAGSGASRQRGLLGGPPRGPAPKDKPADRQPDDPQR